MRPGKVCTAQKYVNRLVSKWTRSSIVKLAAAIAFHNGAGPIDAVPISREGEHGNAAALSPLPGQLSAPRTRMVGVENGVKMPSVVISTTAKHK
jgi:hypothetical protein